MDRETAIRKATHFRIGATIIDLGTRQETPYTGRITFSVIDGTKDYADFNGQRHVGPRYRRKVEQGPSLSAAKRASRQLRTNAPYLSVVTEQHGEDLRTVARVRWAAEDAKKKAA